MAEIASFGVDVDENTKLAQNAQDTANTNATGIKNINDPNYLSPFEKPQLKIQMDNFATIYAADKDIATSEGIDFTAYDAAYQAYLTYMTPLIADMTTYSPIVRSTFNSMVTAVQAEQKRFSTATQAQYTQQINQARTDIANGQTKYEALQAGTETIKTSVASVADTASRAISNAGFASDTSLQASQAASSAVATANEAAAGVTVAKTDAANALTSAASAINNAKSALSEAQSASEKYESLGMVKAWGNTSPQNQNMDNWIWSDPAKSASNITYANGVNAIDYTGVANYEVFNMPIHAKVGDKVSVTFAYTQPSVVSLDGSSNGVPVGFFDHPSKDGTIGANPIYLGVNAQSRKVYTISTTATSETMYLSFNFGYLHDGINWKFGLSVQQDMTTKQPAVLSEYIGFSTKQSNNPADYTWLRNPDKFEGEVQQQITSINGELTSKVSQDTYDSLAGTVEQVSTLSKQNKSALVAKADSQTVDTLKQRVTTAENTLTQTATKTELEQTKTDVDELSNNVNTNASNITAQAGKIDGLLTSTTDINGKLTTLQGNFDLSSEQLSTTMSKVDSMSIGGVNLLPNSDFESSITTGIGTVNSGSYSFSKDYHYHGVQSLKISLASNISSADSGTILKIPNPQISTEYTTTGWLYSEFARTIVISNYSNNWTSLGRTNVQVPEKEWTKFVVHFKTTTITNNAGTAIFVNGVTGDDIQPFYLDCVQIEKGNVATDWSPAPEDNATVTALTQVKQTADGAQVLATNNQGDLAKLQVTATGLTADISKTNSTVSGLQTNYANLQALATGIQTTVGNNYNDLKSQVSQTNSAWQVALSNSGQTNLIYNSEFANNAEGWTVTSNGYLANDPAGTYQGSPGWAINQTASGWIEFGRTKLYKLPVTTVRADNTYSASALVKPYGDFTDGNVLGATLAYFDSNQNRVSGWHDMLITSSASTRNVWTLVKYENYQVPANAIYVGLQFQAYNITGTVHGVINHPMITSGPTVGTYNSDSASQADITALADDINLRVKKGDVVNQFNIDAGGALLSTSGNNTKIVFSSPNIVFDSANPVQIPNANIPGKLTGKTFEAGTITATTKINGTDIEAPLIHSPSGSFKLDGATGDIIGASIQSSDGAWGITANGKISGASVTSSLIDISGDGSGPNFDAENVTPDTATGIYSRYKYTNPNVGFDVNGMGRKMYKNGYLVINGDTFLNRTIGDWSADGGGKYVYDTMYEANVIKMRAYNYTGSNVQTDDPSKTQGGISSRLDIQPSAITMGPNFSVGNPNILIDYTGRIKGGMIATNAAHSIGTTDGGDLYFMRMNKDATNVDGSSISIHANNYYTNNMGLSSGHVINSHDGGDVWLESGWGSGGNTVDLHVKKLYQSSLLSLKTDIKPIDPHGALTEVIKNDVMGYHFKNDKTTDPKSVSVILDDINPIPKYYTSDIFKSADGTGRNDGNIVGYLMLSIKDLNNRLQKLEGAN